MQRPGASPSSSLPSWAMVVSTSVTWSSMIISTVKGRFSACSKVQTRENVKHKCTIRWAGRGFKHMPILYTDVAIQPRASAAQFSLHCNWLLELWKLQVQTTENHQICGKWILQSSNAMSKRSYFEWRCYYITCLYFIHRVKSVNHLWGGISIYWHLGNYNLLSCKEPNARGPLAQLWVRLCPGKNLHNLPRVNATSGNEVWYCSNIPKMADSS